MFKGRQITIVLLDSNWNGVITRFQNKHNKINVFCHLNTVFFVQNEANEEVIVGVCAAGLLIFRQRIRLNRYIWVKILKITYKRNRFSIIVRPDAGEVGDLIHMPWPHWGYAAIWLELDKN